MQRSQTFYVDLMGHFWGRGGEGVGNGSVRKGEGKGWKGKKSGPPRLVYAPVSEILKNTLIAELL